MGGDKAAYVITSIYLISKTQMRKNEINASLMNNKGFKAGIYFLFLKESRRNGRGIISLLLFTH